MINDSHVHVGQFYETYTSPHDLSLLVKNLGVDRYAVSSTTSCERNYDKVIQEIQTIVDINGDKVVPVLWISPEFFLCGDILDKYLNCKVNWKCIKIHPDWQPFLWGDVSNQKNLLDLANHMNVPILIHTGGHEYSKAMVWENLIKHNSGQKFILAHSRPFDQAFSIISKYDNAYGDLAFVDSSDFYRLHDSGACNRILWGSDIPIVKQYVNTNMDEYYRYRIQVLKNAVSDREFKQIVKDNFDNLFKCI